jgi:hypothetical protein
MKECSEKCLEHSVDCPFKECNNWINHAEDHNCDLIAIKKNGPMTLRQIADRLGVSFVRIKQIEDNAVRKIKKGVKDLED